MGLMLISFSYPHRFKFHCLVECRHRFLGGICQHTGGRRGINRRLACDNSVRDQRLVSVDGDVLHNDLLLAPTSMLVEPLGQKRDRTRGFVSELQVFRMSLEMPAVEPAS